MITLLEWQGGVRAFDTALRFGPHSIAHEFGSGVDLLDGTEESPPESRPLQSWGRLLELSKEARSRGMPFSRELAEQEKQRVRELPIQSPYRCLSMSTHTPYESIGQWLLCSRRIRESYRFVLDFKHHLSYRTYLCLQRCCSSHETQHSSTIFASGRRLYLDTLLSTFEHQSTLPTRNSTRGVGKVESCLRGSQALGEDYAG